MIHNNNCSHDEERHLNRFGRGRNNSIGGLSSVLSLGYDDDDDDNFTYTTESSFRLSTSTNQLDTYNDTDLMNIVMKLRGSGGGGDDNHHHSTSYPTIHDTHEEKNDEVDRDMNATPDMNEDLIAKHLKALTITTLTLRKTDQKASQQTSDDVSVMTYGTGLLDLDGSDHDEDETDDDEDDESDDEDDVDDNKTAYAEVDEVMHRLNSLIRSNPHSNQADNRGKSGRELLQQLSQQGACDYEHAPHTASSKKDWLAQLAAELLQETEIDMERKNCNERHSHMMNDNDDVSVAMSVVEIYNHNVQLLEKQAKRAARLLRNDTAVVPSRVAQTSRPRVSTITTTGSKKIPSPLSQQQNTPQASQRTKSSLKSHAESPKRLDQPVNDTQLRKKSTRVEFSETTKSPRQSLPTSNLATSTRTNKPKSNVPSWSLPTSSHAVPTSPRSVTEAPRPLKHHATVTNKTTTTPKEYTSIVIPSGLPPYPGHGPKWPWHPDSPRAPDGYKECYMLHMGEYYHQYMTYLLQRAASTDTKQGECTTTRNEEEVLRKALSSQATFKDHMSKAKSKSISSTPPASTVIPPPGSNGRARKNSVVPIVMAKIEEGSNSSSQSSVNKDSKPVKKTTGVPDANIVGKVHPKSKGKRGTIVVVTAYELDQKAKEEKKIHLQQQQSIPKPKSGAIASELTTKTKSSRNDQGNDKCHKSPATAERRDMTSTTEVDVLSPHCGCTIM